MLRDLLGRAKKESGGLLTELRTQVPPGMSQPANGRIQHLFLSKAPR